MISDPRRICEREMIDQLPMEATKDGDSGSIHP